MMLRYFTRSAKFRFKPGRVEAYLSLSLQTLQAMVHERSIGASGTMDQPTNRQWLVLGDVVLIGAPKIPSATLINLG